MNNKKLIYLILSILLVCILCFIGCNKPTREKIEIKAPNIPKEKEEVVDMSTGYKININGTYKDISEIYAGITTDDKSGDNRYIALNDKYKSNDKTIYTLARDSRIHKLPIYDNVLNINNYYNNAVNTPTNLVDIGNYPLQSSTIDKKHIFMSIPDGTHSHTKGCIYNGVLTYKYGNVIESVQLPNVICVEAVGAGGGGGAVGGGLSLINNWVGAGGGAGGYISMYIDTHPNRYIHIQVGWRGQGGNPGQGGYGGNTIIWYSDNSDPDENAPEIPYTETIDGDRTTRTYQPDNVNDLICVAFGGQGGTDTYADGEGLPGYGGSFYCKSISDPYVSYTHFADGADGSQGMKVASLGEGTKARSTPNNSWKLSPFCTRDSYQASDKPPTGYWWYGHGGCSVLHYGYYNYYLSSSLGTDGDGYCGGGGCGAWKLKADSGTIYTGKPGGYGNIYIEW